MNKEIIHNIDNKVNKILNGTDDIHRFNQSKHAGVCSAGPLFIGALLVCDNARESIETGGNVGNGQTFPANWEIDEHQERDVQRWAEQKGCWIPEAEVWLHESYGQELAQRACAQAVVDSEYFTQLSQKGKLRKLKKLKTYVLAKRTPEWKRKHYCL